MLHCDKQFQQMYTTAAATTNTSYGPNCRIFGSNKAFWQAEALPIIQATQILKCRI